MLLAEEGATQTVAQWILGILLGGAGLALSAVLLWFIIKLVAELVSDAVDTFLDGWYWYIGAGGLAMLIAVAGGVALPIGALIGLGVAVVWAFLASFS